MPDLSEAELLEFRTDYIRDYYVAATGVAAAITLSHYNRGTKSSFFSDAQLEALHDRLQTDYAEELEGVYDVKYAERLGQGDSDADAVTAATAQKKVALFKLMRAECYERMMDDPGFRGSIADETQRAELFKIWGRRIEQDRTFTRSRTSSAFGMVPLVRL